MTSNETQANLFNSLDGAEDISRREKHAKHFDLGCGRYQAVMYSDQVHFADENGAMQEIDNNLESAVENGRSILRNRANPMKVEFPAQTDDGDLVKITHNGKTLSWRMENELPAASPTIRNGAVLKREMLLKHANHMKGRLNKKLLTANVISNAATASLAAEPAALSVKVSPTALKEFISSDLDANAVSALMAAEDVNSLNDEQLEKAVFSVADRRADITHRSAEISYSGLRPGVSARYRMEGTRMKEDIVVDSAEALNEVALLLCNDFNYIVDDQQRVEVMDKQTNEVCFTFNPPLVFDAAGHQEIATVSLENRTSDVRMTYGLSAEFLASAVYPVTIDPVVKTGYKSLTNVDDAYIWEANPSTNYSSPYLMRCGEGEGGESIALIRFNNLINQRASDTIISAHLRLCVENYGAGDPEYFACHPIVSSWTNNKVTWNNMKPSGETKISKNILAYITNTLYLENYFDITNLCRTWYKKDASGKSQNFGVAIRYPSDSDCDSKYVEWTATTGVSGRAPRLVVNYVSHAGLESWWHYEQMSTGRAGTAYVDIYNGNLVYEHSDTSTTGNLMPVSVKHYYNSCLSASDPCSCGLGWRTSMNQTVTYTTIGTNYYVWTDGDGTKHYFDASATPYKDCEGMEMTLKKTDTQITITDKGHNVMTFKKIGDSSEWYLMEIKDPHGNRIVLTYAGTKIVCAESVPKGFEPSAIASDETAAEENTVGENTESEHASVNRKTLFTYENDVRAD